MGEEESYRARSALDATAGARVQGTAASVEHEHPTQPV